MNILPYEKQIASISALTEGCSIRATERLTDTHRDTIMRLGVRVGEDCKRLHDALFRNLHVNLIELDEVWSYVGKKQRRVTRDDGTDVGDQYLFTAMDATGKAILSYMVGKRTADNTQAFVADLRARVINRPNISSDAFNTYPEAVELVRDHLRKGHIVAIVSGATKYSVKPIADGPPRDRGAGPGSPRPGAPLDRAAACR